MGKRGVKKVDPRERVVRAAVNKWGDLARHYLSESPRKRRTYLRYLPESTSRCIRAVGRLPEGEGRPMKPSEREAIRAKLKLAEDCREEKDYQNRTRILTQLGKEAVPALLAALEEQEKVIADLRLTADGWSLHAPDVPHEYLVEVADRLEGVEGKG